MRSPRFDIRSKPLRRIFSPANLEKIWRTKVRVSMRQQYLSDGVENFDFHVERKLECRKLSKLVLDGSYVPQKAQRVLVEKSKGLCRQIVVPSVQDAIILQCLSDALYAQIKGKAPTERSFFEPKEHRFSSVRSTYGTFASWLNFQRELFNFSRNRAFVVITDIANYYDTISYSHLRNIISSITDVEESVLDMLIFVLSDLLWQPDYSPRVEIGLPQIDLDAPRLLAHCFLYELDEFLDGDTSLDFVRYMDDIDIGVDTIVNAKRALRSVDLVLQTKQVRLNSGKTQILTQQEALVHFRVSENARLDRLQDRVTRRLKAALPLDRERKFIEQRLLRGLKSNSFNTGNGEKILKRWLTLASKVNSRLPPSVIERLIRLRPSVRENVLAYVRSQPLTPARARVLSSLSTSQWLLDDAAPVDIANNLVETLVPRKNGIDAHIQDLIRSHDPTTYFGFYCAMWLQSKYASLAELLDIICHQRTTWLPHERLGRQVGALRPLFHRSPLQASYEREVFASYNTGARETYKFLGRLSSDHKTFVSMFDALKSPNTSKGTGITHPKFLCLLSALQNPTATSAQILKLKSGNTKAFEDVYYRGHARRIGVM